MSYFQDRFLMKCDLVFIRIELNCEKTVSHSVSHLSMLIPNDTFFIFKMEEATTCH